VVRRLTTLDQVLEAITTMQVRGAPLIGVCAGYGLCLAARADDSDAAIAGAAAALLQTRPTAVNLRFTVDEVSLAALQSPRGERARAAYARAGALADAEVAACRAIGDHGLALIQAAHTQGRGARPVNVLTHCNAGRLATLEYGTALAPIYRAHEIGLPVHVWVDETRPRNQGWLTAWELAEAGVPHTVIPDTAAGHLLLRGEVDLVMVGTDRTTCQGDVCNKIGTLLTALAAKEARVPFYAAVPSSSIDWATTDPQTIPIEERDGDEVRWVWGREEQGREARIRPGQAGAAVRNPAFDVTPARLVTGLITERGIAGASEKGLLRLFPDRRR
jgi:methylthioribose-1-phosphate isomerase